MTKKASIFKILVEYFRTHPGAVLAWIWVSAVPLLGSLLLASQYNLVEKISLESLTDHLLVTLGISLILGLALLPTTLTALASGFYWGWFGFPALLVGYLLANCLGYVLGRKANADFLTLLYAQNPKLQQEIESRLNHPAGLIFFIRISPVIPFAISNFLFASMRIPLKKVLLYGVFGMLPRTCLAFATGMIANSFLGAKESMNQPFHWLIVILLLILSFIGIYLSWKKKKL